DPVPVAALVIEGGVVHAIATRKGEPIFWYALQAVDLLPRHRRLVHIDRDPRHEDVLDAWASPGGGLWLELEGALGGTRGRACASRRRRGRGRGRSSWARTRACTR